MILGLFFGILTCTWAFSCMLSMDPFPLQTDRSPHGERSAATVGRIQAALRAGRFRIADYAGKPPQAALTQLGHLKVKQLNFTSFDGHPLYLAILSGRETRIIPIHGEPAAEFDKDRVFDMISAAAQPETLADKRILTQYDAYYEDCTRQRPLPVMLVTLRDPDHTRLYIDQHSGRIVGEHSDASSFVTRWLYHGLHSWDYPWL